MSSPEETPEDANASDEYESIEAEIRADSKRMVVAQASCLRA